MYRKFSKKLKKWKDQKTRKPMVVEGARQVGKTFCLEQFGTNEFPDHHIFDFMENPSLKDSFKKDLNPDRIIRDLSLIAGKDINPEKELVIFDVIQECPEALTSLKYFCQKKPEAFIAASGSLLGLSLSNNSFPVGKIEREFLNPMDFDEFLIACKEEKLATFLKTISQDETISAAIHQKVWEYYKFFMITGGLPEVVKNFVLKKDSINEAFTAVRNIQKNIIKDYIDDISKHSGKIKSLKIKAVFNNIPIQLAKETNGIKKFVFKDVLSENSRYSNLEAPIEWLVKAGLVVKVPILKKIEIPLLAMSDEKKFKLYLFDCGILGCMLDLSPEIIFTQDYGSYKGYFAENIVLQELVKTFDSKQIYSWHSNSSEIEFVFEHKGQIIPVEVKSGINTKAKSLKHFIDKYSIKNAFLFSGQDAQNYKGVVKKLPLYLAPELESFIEKKP